MFVPKDDTEPSLWLTSIWAIDAGLPIGMQVHACKVSISRPRDHGGHNILWQVSKFEGL